MTLYDYLRIVRLGWRLVALTVVGALLVASSIVLLSPPRYLATSRVLFGMRGETDPGQLTRSIQYTTAVVQSYAALAVQPVVLDAVAEKVGLGPTAEPLAGRVSARSQKDSLILQISAEDGDPARSAQLANAVATEVLALVTRIAGNEAPRASGAATTAETARLTASTISDAVAPLSPVFPRVNLTLGLGGAAGLLGGILLAIAVGARDRRVIDRWSATGATDLQVIGTMPRRERTSRLRRRRRQSVSRGRAAETATTMLAMTIRSGARTLAFTSAYEDEASLVAVTQLGVALSRLGHRVLMIDADLLAPNLTHPDALQAGPSLGLADVLAGRTTWPEAVRMSRADGPALLTAGSTDPGPDPLVSPAFPALLAEAAKVYDLVLVKAPPALRAADGLLVSALVDRVVLVTDEAAMSEQTLVELAGSLQLVGASPLGLILSA
jgi:capsular polysaccharide biosynthesis protein